MHEDWISSMIDIKHHRAKYICRGGARRIRCLFRPPGRVGGWSPSFSHLLEVRSGELED